MSATTLPWRRTCWAVGGEGWSFFAGSGTPAASPIAQTPGRSCTAQNRSAAIRPPSPSGSPSFATTGCGLTPAVHASVRAGTTSPPFSVTVSLVTASIVVFVRTSIPRLRSSVVANAASVGGTSGITRSFASTSMKRTPSSRARG